MRLNGNKKFLNRITVMYKEKIPEEITELKESLKEKDIESSRWFAHSIDEYASQLGAVKVSEIATEILELLKNKEFEPLIKLLLKLEEENNKVLNEINILEPVHP